MSAELAPPAQLPLDRRTARLTWLYVAALSAVAALSITGQWLVQRSLQQQRGDSTIVNIAGRQRMLSQKLTKAALAWNQATDLIEKQNRAAEIHDSVALWQRSHQGLQAGDENHLLLASLSPVVLKQFADLQPGFEEMVSAAERLLAAENSADQQHQLKILLTREPAFLTAMDAVVFQLDREAQARVARLQKIEWLLLSLTLAVLIGEGFLVFRPAVQRIRQAAHDLQIAKEAAESANEQKTQFLAMLSHELRNPLHAILGNVELALHRPLPEPQRRYLTTIEQAARSLLGLVSDLLDLACIQAGKLRVQPAPFDLRSLGQRCIDMLQPLAKRKHLQLHMTGQGGPLIAIGDMLRVQQVLLNLLGNALKFTDSGDIQLIIRRKENQWRVEVRDTGPGIPPELQPKIFAAFTQADVGSRREQNGVGLGLAISAGLIELMHGRIGVTSEVGRGSCFWFELPLGEEQSAVDLAQNESTATQEVAGCRVLVAEDDQVNQRLLVDFLQTLGHAAVVATDGKEAIETFQQQDFDLVLLDLHMPQLDGIDVAREVRAWEGKLEQSQRTPIIAISAAAAVVAEQVQEAGIDEVLLKPVSLEQLRGALLQLTSKPTAPSKIAARWSAPLARLQGNWELFRDLAAIFLEQLPENLEQLRQLSAAKEFIALGRAAHLLKGQTANFEAADLIAAAAELEEAATAESPARMEASLEKLNAAAWALQMSLQDAIQQQPELVTNGRA